MINIIFRLEESQQFWTVGRREDDTHKYLIVARKKSSLVLELANDMSELDTPLFITSETTISAGDLAGGDISVQVIFSPLSSIL